MYIHFDNEGKVKLPSWEPHLLPLYQNVRTCQVHVDNKEKIKLPTWEPHLLDPCRTDPKKMRRHWTFPPTRDNLQHSEPHSDRLKQPPAFKGPWPTQCPALRVVVRGPAAVPSSNMGVVEAKITAHMEGNTLAVAT